MTPWRVVIAAPAMPFLPCQTKLELHIQALVDAALAQGAEVTLIAPCTQTAIERAGHLRMRSKFLLRPVVAYADLKHREVITNWLEPVASRASRFLLEHPWFRLLDRDQLPTTEVPLNLATAWALWTSACFSLLAQLNQETTIIHALGWQTALVPPMARSLSATVSAAVSVLSPGSLFPPARLEPEVRALLRLPPEAPSVATSLLAWGLMYASAWDLSPQAYQHLTTDPQLAELCERYRATCLLPYDQPETLEHPALARYGRVLATARSLALLTP